MKKYSTLARSRGSLWVALLAIIFTWPTPASARYAEVTGELGDLQRIGAARYQILTFAVFDAELWARTAPFTWDDPFALTLTYRRSISADSLVSRSISGMAERTRISSREQLEPLLRSCFSDVRAGDRFTGLSTSANEARFYLNGRQTCEISWPGFREAFFGIWLDARGGDRAWSDRLTGRANR